MNKKVFGRKFSRSRPAREALFVSVISAMVLNGKIVTTRAKAKAVVGDMEKYITQAKKGTLSARRAVLADLDNRREIVDNLFNVIAPAFSARTSGYTRIISLPPRRGDNAKMVRMEWTDKIVKKEEVKVEKVKTKKEKIVKLKK